MRSPDWHILYRGPLSSCNYACTYCPFAKSRNTRRELADDARRLERFVDWVVGREERIAILFTPWGEALIRRHYQQAFVRLSNAENVSKVAAQTNLSSRLDWLGQCDLQSTALWATWHPSQTTLEEFVGRTEELDAIGVRYSVGVVGLKEHFDGIGRLRARLRPEVYLWVNAFKRRPDYYTATEIEQLREVDPLFSVNNTRHPSLGQSCRAGSTSFTVDGGGDVRRCHFVTAPIGNIFGSRGVEGALAERPCPNETCGCHIGYVHLDRLGQYEIYGDGLMERIPKGWPGLAVRSLTSQGEIAEG